MAETNATDILTRAWEAVQASGVPESLFETAFKEAVVLLGGGTTQPKVKQERRVLTPTNDVDGEDEVVSVDVDALMQTFADETNIDVAHLMEVFYFDSDGTPHLNVSGRKLGESTAAKAKAIGTAIAAAYFYASDDPQVSVEVVRAEVNRLKSFDKKNFFTHMGAVSGTVLSGSGSSRVLRVKTADIEAALRAVVNTARGARD